LAAGVASVSKGREMRHNGVCYEIVGMRPSDHIGWVFEGPSEFEELAGRFLAEGAARGELLMFVAEDPDPSVVADLVDPFGGEGVQVASIPEVYGDSGVVDAAAQPATFAGVLAEAVDAGYSGIRVAADNTPLVANEQRLTAWMRWEATADEFMSANPVTGLCAFDGRRVEIDRLRHLATLHPMVSASTPAPQFRMFADDSSLWIIGLVNTTAVDELWSTLAVLGPKTALHIDLDQATLFSHRVVAELAGIAATGVEVIFSGNSETVDATRAILDNPAAHPNLVFTSDSSPEPPLGTVAALHCPSVHTHQG
jgi:hypothetical protein